MSVAIAGIGRTTYTRMSGRTTRALAAEAARQAISEAGLTPADMDGICTFMAMDSAQPIEVGRALGITELSWANGMYGGGNLVADQIATAAAMIEAGHCKAVVVYRSLNGRSGHRFGSIDGPMQVEGDNQFDAHSGYLVPPQWFAMWARRHMVLYGSTSEDLGHIAITNRTHAIPNEWAVRRDPLTMDDYLSSRWINEPFRVLDCTSEVDGAVAIVLVGDDLVSGIATDPVWLVGSTNSQGTAGMSAWDDLSDMYSRVSGPKIWEKTGLTPADMDVALMYDCFTFTIMSTMEGFGFCERGRVGEYFAKGHATYGGDVVVNPHGGLLSEGYIHGLNHHYEAALQLRGTAGVRQVEDAKLALVTAGAGPFGGANIYSKERP